MANVDKAFGLRALGNLSATGAQKQFGYEIADNQAGAIFQGDLVTLKDGFILQFDPSSHTAAVGVFNGVLYTDPTTGKPTFKRFCVWWFSYKTNINTFLLQQNLIQPVLPDVKK